MSERAFTDDAAEAAFQRGVFAAYLHLNDHRCIRDLGDGRYVALYRFIFTVAIIVGRWGDYDTYEDRWCYHTADDAKAALDAWDGQGEPEGWHRHPGTGRRNPPDPFEAARSQEESR